MRLFESPTFDFVGHHKTGYIISGVLLLISIVSLATRGIETGIDFQGGTEFIVETAQPVPVVDARTALGEALGEVPEVKLYGDDNTLLVRSAVGGEIDELQANVEQGFAAAFPAAQARVVGNESFGPRFANELRRGAVYAVLGALLVILLYISVRFSWRYALGAVVCLIHDVTIVLGIFSLLQGVVPFSLQIDQAIIAAFLTIVGYSLNDTVIIFDRIREFAALFKTERFDLVANKSVNATLSRTVVTSLTTLIVTLVLFVFGGEVLKGFAFALTLGIIIGTYSSIFVATPVVVELRTRADAAK
jgi:preprotein translocase SecF subunit